MSLISSLKASNSNDLHFITKDAIYIYILHQPLFFLTHIQPLFFHTHTNSPSHSLPHTIETQVAADDADAPYGQRLTP